MLAKGRTAIGAVAGAALLATGSIAVVPAQAQSGFHHAPEVQTVGWKGKKWRGGRHWGGKRHWRGRDWQRHDFHRHFRDDDDDFGSFIGPVIGLGAAAVIGSMLVRPGLPLGYDSRDARCAARFRSYDPVSNTYLGYDGHRHVCR